MLIEETLNMKIFLKSVSSRLVFLNKVTFAITITNSTANEGLVRIQYKWLVPIYVFPEMKLLFQKQNYNVLSPSSYTHISVKDLYISRICLHILLQENMWTDPGNI
jgi:hypothetical protein